MIDAKKYLGKRILVKLGGDFPSVPVDETRIIDISPSGEFINCEGELNGWHAAEKLFFVECLDFVGSGQNTPDERIPMESVDKELEVFNQCFQDYWDRLDVFDKLRHVWAHGYVLFTTFSSSITLAEKILIYLEQAAGPLDSYDINFVVAGSYKTLKDDPQCYIRIPGSADGWLSYSPTDLAWLMEGQTMDDTSAITLLLEYIRALPRSNVLRELKAL